jgi:hypothetical protein
MPRLDTRLEAEAAEFLVLGQLLLNRIPNATKLRKFKLRVAG